MLLLLSCMQIHIHAGVFNNKNVTYHFLMSYQATHKLHFSIRQLWSSTLGYHIACSVHALLKSVLSKLMLVNFFCLTTFFCLLLLLPPVFLSRRDIVNRDQMIKGAGTHLLKQVTIHVTISLTSHELNQTARCSAFQNNCQSSSLLLQSSSSPSIIIINHHQLSPSPLLPLSSASSSASSSSSPPTSPSSLSSGA